MRIWRKRIRGQQIRPSASVGIRRGSNNLTPRKINMLQKAARNFELVRMFSNELGKFRRELLGKGKGKAVPLQAWTDPKGSRRLRLPDFKKIGT